MPSSGGNEHCLLSTKLQAKANPLCPMEILLYNMAIIIYMNQESKHAFIIEYNLVGHLILHFAVH